MDTTDQDLDNNHEGNDSPIVLELASFQSPRRKIVLRANGDVKTVVTDWVKPLKMLDRRSTHQFSLPLRTASRDSVDLQPGLFIVSGNTSVGKSRFVRALIQRDPTRMLRLMAVEPPDDPEELETARMFYSVDAAMIYATTQVDTSVLTAIDSLRAPLFEAEGAAGSKGITASFFTMITRVSNSLARNGLTMIATVNPMETDASYVKEFHSKLSASVPGYLWLESSSDTEFRGKVAVRPERRETDFVFNSQSAPAVTAESVTFPTFSSATDEIKPLSAAGRALINDISAF